MRVSLAERMSVYSHPSSPLLLVVLVTTLLYLLHGGLILQCSAFVSSRSPLPTQHHIQLDDVLRTVTTLDRIRYHCCSVSQPQQQHHPSTTTTSLFDSKYNSDDRNEQRDEEDRNTDDVQKKKNNKKVFDVESARSQLETLISKDDNVKKNSIPRKGRNINNATKGHFSIKLFLDSIRMKDLSDPSYVIGLPPAPPLSTMDRNRRELELSLLELLKEGDTFLNELWELWYSERGPDNQSILAKTDAVVSNPKLWGPCEEILVALIDDRIAGGSNPSGLYFVEAVNRLATLYFLQGRLVESYKLCRVVIQLKPWHVGALSGIVQVCVGLSFIDEARYWAPKRLPTIPPPAASSLTEHDIGPLSKKTNKKFGITPDNPRRIEWCDRAIADAKALLKRAEQSTVECFGQPEEYYYRRPSTKEPMEIEYDDADAWQ